MDAPFITVLMTVYNGGQYLRQAVESVLKQTHRNFEFLIINDCSTDDFLKTIQSFGDERIVIHNNTQNIGQTKSLNVGLKLAKGRYIARIDADDIAFPDWLEKQVAFARSHPDYAVVSTQAVVIDERNQLKKIFYSPSKSDDIILRSLTDAPINHGGSIMNRVVILENGGYDENYKIIADYDLWGKLLRNNLKITSTKDVLMAVRIHGERLSLKGQGRTVISETSAVMRKNMDHFTNFKITDNDLNLLYKAVYSTGDLTESEFVLAVGVLKKVYQEVNPSSDIEKIVIEKWLKKQSLSIYLKRIYAFLTDKNYAMVRTPALKGIREFGLISVFTPFFIASLFGGLFLQSVPFLYSKLLQKRTHCKLNCTAFHVFP